MFIYYDDGNTIQWVVTNPVSGLDDGLAGDPVRYSPYETRTFNPVPLIVDRKNKVFAWDIDGNPISSHLTLEELEAASGANALQIMKFDTTKTLNPTTGVGDFVEPGDFM